MLTSFGKKVEVFLFYLVKRHLNGVSDYSVRRCFTSKNGGKLRKKSNCKHSGQRFFALFFVPTVGLKTICRLSLVLKCNFGLKFNKTVAGSRLYLRTSPPHSVFVVPWTQLQTFKFRSKSFSLFK